MSEQPNQPQLSSGEIARLLSIQEAEIQVRSQELSVRGKEIDANARSAEKSIDAQLEAEKLRQQAFLGHTKSRAWLTGGLIIAVLIVIVVALVLDKDAFAMEILKQIAVAVGSFAGGYAVRSFQKSEQSGD